MRKVYTKPTSKVSLDEERDEKGNLIFARNFLDYGISGIREMTKFDAVTPGYTFYDYRINKQSRIGGGEFWIHENSVDNVNSEDIVEMSVIDKDDVLGLFSILGLTPGVDILEVSDKFVKNEYIQKGSKENGYHSMTTYNPVIGSNVPEGLYIRFAYKSHGVQPLTIMIRLEIYTT